LSILSFQNLLVVVLFSSFENGQKIEDEDDYENECRCLDKPWERIS